MRTTLSINDKLLQALKIRAIESGTNVSSLVERAVTDQLLEDLYDIELADSRKSEKVESFESLVEELKSENLL